MNYWKILKYYSLLVFVCGILNWGEWYFNIFRSLLAKMGIFCLLARMRHFYYLLVKLIFSKQFECVWETRWRSGFFSTWLFQKLIWIKASLYERIYVWISSCSIGFFLTWLFQTLLNITQLKYFNLTFSNVFKYFIDANI